MDTRTFTSVRAGLPGANTNGWEAQATGNLSVYIGVTADFDGHYGSVFGVGGHDYNFLFGPTLSYRTDKVTGFAHLLFGGSHAGAPRLLRDRLRLGHRRRR